MHYSHSTVIHWLMEAHNDRANEAVHITRAVRPLQRLLLLIALYLRREPSGKWYRISFQL